MKERVIIAFAICVLVLSACGSLVGTSTLSSSSAPHPKAPIATSSMQSACLILHNRQAQLNLEYHTASTQLAAAQALLKEAFHSGWRTHS